jgi:phosphate transport system substrate-binding protein
MLFPIGLSGQARIVLAGSGSAIAGPIFSVWTREFNRSHNLIQVSYVPTNSGEGIRQVTLLLGDFAIGEIPLSGAQMKGAKVKLNQIPIAVLAVVPVYNLPVRGQIRFTGELLAQIYMGKIANWNDVRIAALNPSLSLPDLPIVTVQRSSGSGTRYVFTEFLARSSHEFRGWLASSPNREWGKVTAAKSKDMAQQVKSTSGAIGYVELNYAVGYALPYGSLGNRAGKFVEASPDSIGEACNAKAQTIADDFQEPMIDAEGDGSYPLISFAWAYLPVAGLDSTRKEALTKFLSWSLRDGQDLLQGHGYYPLPPAIATRAQVRLERLLQ